MDEMVTTGWVPDLSAIPHGPGCYLYKAAHDGEILYVGKAKDLRKRVTQYFQRMTDQKTAVMLSRARHVEWILTSSEVEALILEARLIREHKPSYNIDLKDDKRYAYLQFTDDEYPRIITSRTVGKDIKRRDLYGPFTDGAQRFGLQHATRKLFRLRACSTMPRRVCLYYHIGQCSGPCEGKISRDDYLRDVSRARLFLQGHSPALIAELEASMKRASDERRFEDAKHYRDMISGVTRASSRSVTGAEKRYDEDVLVWRRQEDGFMYLVMHVKKGMITGTQEFLMPHERVDVDAPMDDFLKSYYQDAELPDEIILEDKLRDDAIPCYLTSIKQRLTVVVTHHGPKRALLDVARQNIDARIKKTEHVLFSVQEDLRLPNVPRVIDAFDNSHLQGTNVVGACVRFVDTKPSKQHYRKFIVAVQKNDDVAAMREVVTRRYRGVLSRKESPPDLILIDGGKAQLNAAYDALQLLGLRVPIIGLAKRDEEVFVPGLLNPLQLDAKSDSVLFLRRVRDEIHRFVITFHRARRSKAQASSFLDGIVGIGETTRFALLREFKTVASVKTASDKALLCILNRRQLSALRSRLAQD